MSKDTPRSDPPPTVRGKEANHGDPATFMSYLSSILYLTSVPGTLLLAYLGYRFDLYPYPYIIPAYAGLFIVILVVISVLMRFQTTIQT